MLADSFPFPPARFVVRRFGQTSVGSLALLIAVSLTAVGGLHSLSLGLRTSLTGANSANVTSLTPALTSAQQAGMGATFVKAGRILLARAKNSTLRTRFANPMLRRSQRFNFEKLRPEHLAPAQEVLLRRAERQVTRIVKHDGPRTYDNTIKALDDATREVEEVRNAAETLNLLASTDEWFYSLRATEEAYDRFMTNLSLRREVWKAIQDYAKTEEAVNLDALRKRHLNLLMDDYIAKGANLGPEQQARVLEIRSRMSELSTQMGQNTKDSQGQIAVHIADEARLVGLPENTKSTLASAAEADGKNGYLINYATANTVAAYADDAALRKELFDLVDNISSEGHLDNTPLMSEMLELRRELAELTGFDDYADLMTRDRMAKTGERAQTFIEEILERTAPRREQDAEEFATFMEGKTGSRDVALWDEAYYRRMFDESKSGFDPEVARPYFEMDNVVDSAFGLLNELFGVRIQRTNDLPLYHPDARTYRMFREDGTIAGDFYLDLVARPGTKRSGAFQWGIRSPDDAGKNALALVVANVEPPAAGKPVLLTPRNAVTVFHELGHLTHDLLSDVPVRPLRGTNVARDFVEFPSQLLENWARHEFVIRQMGRHHETGAPIPDALVRQILEAQVDGAALKEARTARLALLDLKLHREYDPAIHGSLRKYTADVFRPHISREIRPESNFVNRFGHIQDDGYAAGYYVYQWAGAHEADAFSRFDGKALFDSAEGRRFRDIIYRRGNAEDANDLYERLMGRPLDSEAFFRRMGL